MEVFDETATFLEPVTGTIDGPGQTRVPLGEIPTSGFGIRVTGDGPFGAAVVGRSETAAAGDRGHPNQCVRLVGPGPLAVPADARLRLLNAGAVDLDITYTALTPSGRACPARWRSAAGAVETGTVTRSEVTGVFVSGNGAFSVAWWAEAAGAAMFGERFLLNSDALLRLLVVVVAAAAVVGIARFRPRRRRRPLHVEGNLSGPGVYLFTAGACDSCDSARIVYKRVLGQEGFTELTWDDHPELLTRLGGGDSGEHRTRFLRAGGGVFRSGPSPCRPPAGGKEDGRMKSGCSPRVSGDGRGQSTPHTWSTAIPVTQHDTGVGPTVSRRRRYVHVVFYDVPKRTLELKRDRCGYAGTAVRSDQAILVQAREDRRTAV